METDKIIEKIWDNSDTETRIHIRALQRNLHKVGGVYSSPQEDKRLEDYLFTIVHSVLDWAGVGAEESEVAGLVMQELINIKK